ncbi:hypothetical protein [Ahrensia sp. R2A130]|uniref:hypothetical protein n=1 Tax=Ahrensia sp. R2A130 TaxID=744979 RepID=UPI0001E0F83C|nr:hypothetical protein [Ahrensia sp. R2A130]EFL90484.1 putative biogenesis protein MshI [Ahrensia sp. R2A130]
MTDMKSKFARAMGVALTTALLGGATPAFASDAHCFPNAKFEPSEPEDRYALGLMTDPEQVAAIEELQELQWSLRLSVLPVTRLSAKRDFFPGRDPLEQLDAVDGTARLTYEDEIANRRTGSKYMYVSPAMKRLARQRSELRSLKRKPCNPHVLYLGSY